MATLILTSADAGKTIPVSGSLDWDVYGTDAADTIEVAAGASAIVRGGAGTDVVKLLGGSADYTVKLSGSNVVFTHTSTGKTVTVPVTSAGDSVSFGNGTAVTLKSTGSVVTLGAQTISATDAAVTGATGTATGSTPTTAGQAFSLTTTAETKALTVGNDTVSGDVVDSIVGDTIVDTSTTDSDTLTATISTSPATAFVITNVENITIDDRFGGSTVSAANISGGNLTMKSSAGNTSTVSNIGTAANNLQVTAGDNITTLTLNQATGTTDSAVTLNVAGKTLSAFVGTVDLLTINATGAASSITGSGAGFLSDDAGDKIIVKGSANLTLTDTNANLKDETIEKSGYTGVLEVRASTTDTGDYSNIAADNIRFTAAGAGGDTITVKNNQKVTLFGDVATAANVTFTTANSGGTLSLVADTVDVIGNASVAHVGTTNFSTVNVSAGDTSTTTSIGFADFTGESTTTVNVNSGAKATTFSGTTVAKEIKADAAMTGSLTVAIGTTGVQTVTGGAGGDVLQLSVDRNFSFDGGAGSADILDFITTTTNDLSDNTIALSNVEYIRANTATTDFVLTFSAAQLTGKTLGVVGAINGATADSLTVALGTSTSFDGSGISTNNVTGTKHVDITVTGTAVNDTIKATQSADTVNANAGADSVEGLAGNDTIDGGTGNDTILGGTGGDSITGGAGADSITGGDGADVYVIAASAGSTAGAVGGTFSGNDVITDFKAGSGAYDKLSFAIQTNEADITTTKATAADNTAYFVASAPVIGGTAITALTATDFTNVDKVVTFLNAIATSTGNATDVFTFIVNDTTNGKAAIYHVTESGTATFAATEVELIGVATLTNGAIAQADFN